jgi:signal peptidase
MKRLLKIIYWVFICLIVVIALMLIVSVFPITGNIKFFTVQSGSMEPAVKMGGIVMVKPVDEYKIGDVITFGEVTKEKSPTTHRIYDLKIQGGQSVYLTKGDANEDPDQKEIAKRDVIGKVIVSAPYLGYAVDFARKPIGFALIIIVPAALIVFDELRKIVYEIKKKKKTE